MGGFQSESFQRVTHFVSNSNLHSYRPRNPEESLLFQIIRNHWKTFEEITDLQGNGLPKFVRNEFESYFRCGVLQHGFVRMKCDSCNHEKLIGFSCKKRGFCPSCIGRRMGETAAKLNDFVLPEVPYRQWVISFPIPLRFLMARKPGVLGQILTIYISEVSRLIRRKARAKLCDFDVSLERIQTGAYTAIQRFGSSLSLNIHFHSIFFDGAYLLPSSRVRNPEFLEIAAPSNKEMGDLLIKIVKKIKTYLVRAGYLTPEGDLIIDPETSEDLFSQLQAASVQNLIAGNESGKKVKLIKSDPQLWHAKIETPRWVDIFGFSLHANTDVSAKSRDQVEKLIRYLTRPPITEERLHRLQGGDLYYEFKNRWSDGTTGIKFTPLEFLEKLAALVPLPRRHLFRYHGLLAPNSKNRPKIIRMPVEVPKEGEESRPPKRSPWISWSDLLKRVFQLDLTQCPDCGGKVRFVSAIIKKDVLVKILGHFNLPVEPPKFAPARKPP